MSATSQGDSSYDISVAARLTGLSPANLRMWEKRYDVVEPSRSESGRRIYSDDDVRRLTLLKSLSDSGQAIRTTHRLSLEELELLLLERCTIDPSSKTTQKRKPEAACRTTIVGGFPGDTLHLAVAELKGLSATSEYPMLGAAEAGAPDNSADLLLIDCPTLFDDTVDRIHRLIGRVGAVRAIVVYSYSQSRLLDKIDEGLSRITAIRGPVTLRELSVVCSADIALAKRTAAGRVLENAPVARSITSEKPPRQFTEAQLAKMTQISSAIDCECPQHLAGLITKLVGFEQYSAECESRNAADAEMHSYLHKATAHARAILEDALGVLVEFEGIDIESQTAGK
ncbi:MAG: MerR family transcriptional regulator [Verrucomicrobiales bacterium]